MWKLLSSESSPYVRSLISLSLGLILRVYMASIERGVIEDSSRVLSPSEVGDLGS